MNEDKLKTVKQNMEHLNIVILSVNKLEWTGAESLCYSKNDKLGISPVWLS